LYKNIQPRASGVLRCPEFFPVRSQVFLKMGNQYIGIIEKVSI